MVRRLLPALLVLAACHPLPPQGNAVAELARGLPRPVILDEPGSDRVVVRATVLAGSSRDPIGREGLAALAARVAARPGVELTVGVEQVELRADCPRADARTCVDAVADVLLVGAPDADGLAAAVAATPAPPVHAAARADALLAAWVYEGHAYGHAVDGRPEVLPLLRPDEVGAFRARQWTRAQTVVGLAGPGVTELVPWLEARLGALSSRLPADHPLMRPVPRPGRVLVRAEGEGVAVRAGSWLDVDPDAQEAVALALGLAALGPDGGEGGVLGPATAPGWPDAVLPDLAARHPLLRLDLPVASGAALAPALRALEAAVVAGPSPERVEAARTALAARLAADAADADQRLRWAMAAVAADRHDPLAVLPGALASVSAEAAAAALRAHLRPEALVVVVVAPDAASWPADGVATPGEAAAISPR